MEIPNEFFLRIAFAPRPWSFRMRTVRKIDESDGQATEVYQKLNETDKELTRTDKELTNQPATLSDDFVSSKVRTTRENEAKKKGEKKTNSKNIPNCKKEEKDIHGK